MVRSMIVGMGAEIPPGVVVVLDVIRAFTTAAVAFERAAREITCVSSLEAGRDLRRRFPDRLLAGESRGLKPADHDFGNSPSEMSTARLDGRQVIQSTSNGTVGLVRCPDPVALLAASARNVGATARWIAANQARTPWTILCTGRTAEDWACAEYLSDLLRGVRPSRADWSRASWTAPPNTPAPTPGDRRPNVSISPGTCRSAVTSTGPASRWSAKPGATTWCSPRRRAERPGAQSTGGGAA